MNKERFYPRNLPLARSTIYIFSTVQISMPFPEEGQIYDYRLDDGGVSKTGEDEEEEENKKTKVRRKY